MPKPNPHTRAAEAMRTAVSEAIRTQIAKMEREARVALRIEVMSDEGRELQSRARALREQAKETGWLR